jgi:hypothetical protein
MPNDGANIFRAREINDTSARRRQIDGEWLAGAQNDSGPEFRNGQQNEFRNDEDTATNVTR